MRHELLRKATNWGFECYCYPQEVGNFIEIVRNNWHFQEIEGNKWTLIINGVPQLYLTTKDLLIFLEKLNYTDQDLNQIN